MPNSILHKRSSTSGVVPHAALLANGEIALNTADGTWFIKKTDGTVLDLRQPLITDGGAQPLAGINADAQDWQTRVIAAGGTVSAPTFTAVNNFCNAITAAGIRDRFYRLNLFCGNNLAACLVPLYRGPSLTGTQFGNTTDTNVNNNFVAGDYVETGVTGGLKGNGSNKALRTGLLPADMGGPLHLSVALMSDATVNQIAIGADNFNDAGWTSASIDFATPGNGPLVPRSALSSSVGVNFTNTISASTTGRLVSTSSRASGATQRAYFNGAPSATNTPTYQTQPAFDFAIFGSNRKNTSIVSYAAARLSSYSIGVDMTDAQVAAFDAAVRAFQVALNRTPPVVSNADAQDWVNRVYTAGGTVSTTTAAAVNNFCSTIDAAGIRDRFYRLNLFCGDNLTACLVPLYRGQSLGGTQYGNAIDTNFNFTSGAYVETGANGGLSGGNPRYLDTGLAISALPTVSTGHMAAYKAAGTSGNAQIMGVRDATDTHLYRLFKRGNSDNDGCWGALTVAQSATDKDSNGFLVVSRTSSTVVRLFNNGAQVAENTTSTTPASISRTIFVFADNVGSATSHWPASIPLRAYSVGAALSNADVTAYTAAMQTFQTALNRPPAVSNADAQDWISRVYAAGGTVSQSTADAVNTFCNTITNTGLRDRFYRLNLFCGNDLTACRVPLYRGPSLSGTQYGNTIDTNFNFLSSDYVETGSNGGLTGNGSNKYLMTGFPGNTLATGNRHLSAYESLRDTTAYKAMLGVQDDTAGTYFFTLTNGSPGTVVFASFQAQAFSAANNTVGGHWIATDPTGTSLFLYKNTAAVAFSSAATRALPNSNGIAVFGTQNTPASATTVGGITAARLNAYSIGLGLSETQVVVYNAAMQTFQTALRRNV